MNKCGVISKESKQPLSDVSVMNWVHAYGKKARNKREPISKTKVVEIDEMHTYVGNKKNGLDLDSNR